MKFHNVEQNTDEWLDLRIGKIGGSTIGKIMANYGKAFGDPAKREAIKIALEKITGRRDENRENKFKNKHIDRGHEQEPIARMKYQDMTFCNVTNGGFFDASEYIGVSTDGFVDKDGEVEIKCTIGSTYFQTVKRGAFDPKYEWQLKFNLKSTEMEWIDYIEYCSEFPDEKQLFIDRIYAKDCTNEFEMIDERMGQFIELVEQNIEVIKNI